jgi:peptidoglycan/xylan/chitin deacetylase (PgdA/CDA1 family)
MIDRLLRPPAVLVYHGIADVPGGEDPHRLLTSPRHLEAHVRFLRRRGYEFATAEDVLHGPPKPGTIVLTFDDGWCNWVSVAAPLLERLGVRATFYLCPGLWGGQHADVAGPEGRLLDEDGARILHERGFALGAHSLTHPDLRSLGDGALERELRASKEAVEEITGRACRTFAYPFGLFDARVVRAAGAAGYELAFGWLPGPWRPLEAPRLPAPPKHGPRRLAAKLLGLRRPGR